MLRSQPIRHVSGDFDRRWMSDDFFDLVVWYEDSGEVHGFQLCYDRKNRERALMWKRTHGFVHSEVDSGESGPLSNDTPVLQSADVDDIAFDFVVCEFTVRTSELDPVTREFVLERLAAYVSARRDESRSRSSVH